MDKLIYIADDEENILKLLSSFLTEEGYRVKAFSDGESLLEDFKNERADLVILDVCMPKKDGYTVCSSIRKMSDIPIILLTARDGDADYITGFVSGCDDYFTKPFSPVKLTLRIKNIFEREFKSPDNLTIGDIEIFPKLRTVTCKKEELRLTGIEFGIMVCLCGKAGFGVSRGELLDTVWGYESDVETRAVDDAVKRLRKKLSEAKSDVFIETVWGYGFKIATDLKGYL